MSPFPSNLPPKYLPSLSLIHILDNKYTVLDISELSGDLLTAGMFVALDYVWDKAKQNRTVEKTIFIDECWALIGGSANRLAANFVLEIAKIIRGYGGSAVFATQDLNCLLYTSRCV